MQRLKEFAQRFGHQEDTASGLQTELGALFRTVQEREAAATVCRSALEARLSSSDKCLEEEGMQVAYLRRELTAVQKERDRLRQSSQLSDQVKLCRFSARFELWFVRVR